MVEAGIRYLHLVRTPICWIVLLQKSLTWLVKFRSEPISIPSSLIFWDRSNLTPPDVPFLLPSTIDWLKRELKASSAEQVVRKNWSQLSALELYIFKKTTYFFMVWLHLTFNVYGHKWIFWRIVSISKAQVGRVLHLIERKVGCTFHSI